MARDGYLIIDSDMHFNEPDDLWAVYLEEPYKANPPRFFGGQKQALNKSADDKGNADSIRSMEVQGLTIPAFASSAATAASGRELRRRPHHLRHRRHRFRRRLDEESAGRRGPR